MHGNFALFSGGYHFYGKGLYNGNQSHVRVRRHSDGTDIIRMQNLRHKQGGRTVRRTDDGDGSGILKIKAKDYCKEQGCKNAELCSSSEKKQYGF